MYVSQIERPLSKQQHCSSMESSTISDSMSLLNPFFQALSFTSKKNPPPEQTPEGRSNTRTVFVGAPNTTRHRSDRTTSRRGRWVKLLQLSLLSRFDLSRDVGLASTFLRLRLT